MNSGKPPIWAIIVAHLKADARKTAVLVVLTTVMLFLYGRWFLSEGTPQAAEAATPVVAPAPVTTVTATAVPATRPASIQRHVIARPIERELSKDPFMIDLQQFPMGHEDAKTKSGDGPRNIEDPIETAAKQLVLQSTLSGPRPMACINGEFLRPGERINGFVIQQVEPTRVVLTRESVIVELYLK